MSHYNTLGVSDSAAPDEIKKAYRKLASQHHPDKGGDTAKFQQIEEAYRVLSDPNQKAQYDAQLRGGPSGFRFTVNGQDIDGGVPPGMEDIFSRFGFNFGHNPFHQPRKNKDLRVDITLDLASTLQPQTKTVSIQTTNGDRQTVEIQVPRTISNGASIKYSGLGDNFFNTLPRGDLYVHFTVPNTKDFDVIDTVHLGTRLEIDCLSAIVGCERQITTLDGKEFLVTIPPGTTFGTKLRIKGQGRWYPDRNERGDIYILIFVDVPNDLSEEDKDLIRDIISRR